MQYFDFRSDAPTQVYNQLPAAVRNGHFGWALAQLRAGNAVQRAGWNGKGMFLFFVSGSTFNVAEGRPMAAHFPVGTEVKYHAHIDMKTAQGDVVPWLASQTDILADDWQGGPAEKAELTP